MCSSDLFVIAVVLFADLLLNLLPISVNQIDLQLYRSLIDSVKALSSETMRSVASTVDFIFEDELRNKISKSIAISPS